MFTVLFDYENLHIGLKQRGWRPDAKALIEAARQAVGDLGDIVNDGLCGLEAAGAKRPA